MIVFFKLAKSAKISFVFLKSLQATTILLLYFPSIVSCELRPNVFKILQDTYSDIQELA